MEAVTAIAALSFALMEGSAYGWGSPIVIAAFVLALVSAALFARAEMKGPDPLLPLGMFRNATVSAGMIAGMAVNIGLSGILFALPLFFQQARGLSAHTAGLALLPMTIPLVFNPIVTGRIVGRIGARIPMTAGFLLAAAGTILQLRMVSTSDYALPLIGLFLIGLGVSLTIPALMTAVISAVPREQTGAASGALNSSRQVGATLGVAMIGAILGGAPSMTAGMRLGLALTAAVLLAGSLLSFAFIGRKGRNPRTGR